MIDGPNTRAILASHDFCAPQKIMSFLVITTHPEYYRFLVLINGLLSDYAIPTKVLIYDRFGLGPFWVRIEWEAEIEI